MKDILIYGAGGFGREIACLINHINEASGGGVWNLKGFLDDGIPQGFKTDQGDVLGDRSYFEENRSPVAVVIAIADPFVMKGLAMELQNFDFIEFPNLAAPNTIFFDKGSFQMGQGNLIFFGCRFSCNVHLGDFNVLNGQVAFGHDVSVGNYNSFGPSSRLSGHVTVGDTNFFGLGSSVLQNKSVSNDVRIGAMSVLMRNAREGKSYFGNPATVMNF